MARTNLMMVTLIYLFRRLEDGEILAPEYTRGFVWKKSMIIQLLESIYLGYPVGTIMAIEGRPDQFVRADHDISRFPVFKETLISPFSTLWVIDGLQRIVSLYGTLKGDYAEMDVYFDLRQNRFLPKPRAANSDSVLKMSSLFDYTKFMELQERLFQNEDAAGLVDSLHRLHRAFTEYEIPLQIVSDVEINEVVQVFARLNKTGRALNRHEIDRVNKHPDPKMPI